MVSTVYAPGTLSNFGASTGLHTTNRAPPRAIRSARSVGPTAVVVGMITAPSFMIASIVSHSSTWLPSITITASPRATPCRASHAATRSEAVAIWSNVRSVDVPSSSTMTRAGLSLPRATASNQSTAQLKRSPTSGQENSACARSGSSRRSSSRSRAAR